MPYKKYKRVKAAVQSSNYNRQMDGIKIGINKLPSPISRMLCENKVHLRYSCKKIKGLTVR